MKLCYLTSILLFALIIPATVLFGDDKKQLEMRATLGIECHPSLRLGETGYGTRGESGLIIDATIEGSALALAGLRVGDKIIQVNDNVIFSVDDLNDILALSQPGNLGKVYYIRDGAERTVEVKFGEKYACDSAYALHWDYAGLAQLPLAMKEAARRETVVLVGLSGSDT